MKKFIQYLKEVFTFKSNNSFVLAGGKLDIADEKTSEKEHPEAFPNVFFSSHPYKPTDSHTPKTTQARAWGRIDHINKVVHILTDHAGVNLITKGYDPTTRDSRAEQDATHRIEAAKQLQRLYPDYRINHRGLLTPIGATPTEEQRKDHTLSYEEHETAVNRALGNHFSRSNP